MNIVTIKTANLIGPALDWAVDQIVGGGHEPFFDMPSYSTDWSQGGPLIEKFKIGLLQPNVSPCGEWHSSVWHPDFTDYTHKTNPLIAACRAIVAAKLGDEVKVPAELVQP